MKQMDIFTLVDDGIQKRYHSANFIYVCKQRKKRNSKIIPLIYSFCSVVMFLQMKLLYNNDLFSVSHYL